jgi:hypothetical protein
MGRGGAYWITDRLPCADDADLDGDVVVQIQPETDEYRYKEWKEVPFGTPWRHTGFWRQHRRFIGISRTIDANGDHILDAIASDGTAWWKRDAEWEQITPLP